MGSQVRVLLRPRKQNHPEMGGFIFVIEASFEAVISRDVKTSMGRGAERQPGGLFAKGESEAEAC